MVKCRVHITLIVDIDPMALILIIKSKPIGQSFIPLGIHNLLDKLIIAAHCYLLIVILVAHCDLFDLAIATCVR